MRVILFSKTGQQLAETNAQVVCSWKLNDIGKAKFTLSINDPVCRREFIEFGNRVLLEHEELPDWVGVIDTPREWSSFGTVDITAYSAEYLLKWRRCATSQKITGTSGTKFAELIKKANAERTLYIDLGDIWNEGKATTEQLQGESIYDAIKRISTDLNHDFALTANIQPNGDLRFYANWYKQRGKVNGCEFIDGWNIKTSNRVLIEQGEIVNDVMAVGVGASSGSQKTGIEIDMDSAGQYDYRQGVVNLSTEFDGTVSVGAAQQLGKLKEPRRTYDLNAIGTIWKDLHIGDTYRLTLNNCGFSSGGFGLQSDVRVVGMELNERMGTVRIISDEVTDGE